MHMHIIQRVREKTKKDVRGLNRVSIRHEGGINWASTRHQCTLLVQEIDEYTKYLQIVRTIN